MNNLNSLRPVTRRSIHLFYHSPGICELTPPFSGSGASSAANLSITPVTRRDGPATLNFSVAASNVTLTWPLVDYIFAYVVYRATNVNGPFTLLTSNLHTNSFVDMGVAPGIYYYKVTGVEPDFGETLPTPTVTVTI